MAEPSETVAPDAPASEPIVTVTLLMSSVAPDAIVTAVVGGIAVGGTNPPIPHLDAM